MDRVRYEEADLDVYVNPGHGSVVGKHMVNVQGYRVIDQRGDADPVVLDLRQSIDRVIIMAMTAAMEGFRAKYNQHSIHIVYNMQRITEGGRTQRVQVIVTSECVFHAIMGFHSTCVMNVITYDRAISFYPLATFELRKNQEMALYGVSLSSADSARAAIEKYRGRDFATRRNHSVEESGLLFQHGCERQVGDRWCWTLHLNMTGVSARQWIEDGPWEYINEEEMSDGGYPSAQLAQDPIMHNKWRMTGFLFIMSPKYCLLRLPIFRYGYAVADDGEALWAREFSDDIVGMREKGGCKDRKWFDDILNMITAGRIRVLQDDAIDKVGDDAEDKIYDVTLDLTNDDHYPGRAYPLKVTGSIRMGYLLAMFTRYRSAYDSEEREGRLWRAKWEETSGKMH
ncbi:hypothetical protein HWV62_349 [Athelia sp. TMB]|nr:hypothetical protein HWV62_349 [Athelia sp. TMB]